MLFRSIIPVNEDVTDLTYVSDFDLVLCLGLLHHIPEGRRQSFIESCVKYAVPGGEIVVQTDEDIDVPAMMKAANLTYIKTLYEHVQERSAWMATVPVVVDKRGRKRRA